jgi:hypothetical protein
VKCFGRTRLVRTGQLVSMLMHTSAHRALRTTRKVPLLRPGDFHELVGRSESTGKHQGNGEQGGAGGGLRRGRRVPFAAPGGAHPVRPGPLRERPHLPPRRRVPRRARAGRRRHRQRPHLRWAPLRGSHGGWRALDARGRPLRRRRPSPRAQLCPLPRLLLGCHRARRRRHHCEPAVHRERDRHAGRRRRRQARHHSRRPPAQGCRAPPPSRPPRWRLRRRHHHRLRGFKHQRYPLQGPRRRGAGDGVPPPADQAERHGGAAVLVGHDGSEQGRHPDARQLHRGARHVHVGPGRARGGAQRIPLLPAHVPPLRALHRHARAAAARERRRRDAAVRRRLRDGRRAAAPRHVPLLRAAGDGRARQAREGREVRSQLAQAHPLRRRAARQGCHGSRGQGLPRRRHYPGNWASVTVLACCVWLPDISGDLAAYAMLPPLAGIRYDRDMWDHIARESRKGKSSSTWVVWNTRHTS